jgi:hypothetical protein
MALPTTRPSPSTYGDSARGGSGGSGQVLDDQDGWLAGVVVAHPAL